MTARPLPVRRVLESNEQFAKLLQRVRENSRNAERVRRLLPTYLAGNLSAALFKEGRLVLLTTSPVWASRLRFAVPGLRASLNHVGEIRVKVLPPSGTARPPMHDRPRARTLSAHSAEQIRVVLKSCCSHLYRFAKFIAVDKQAYNDVMHFLQLRKANRFSCQALDTSSQS